MLINRRKRKYAKTSDNSLAARQAYSRHDGREQPEDISEDVPPEYLEKMKTEYYQAHIVVDRGTGAIVGLLQVHTWAHQDSLIVHAIQCFKTLND